MGIAYGVVIEDVIGGDANDVIIDNFVDNRLWGGAGNDHFYLGAGGYDFVDGGDGHDSLFLSITRDQASWFTVSPQVTLLVADNMAVELQGIEQIQFTNQLVSLIL